MKKLYIIIILILLSGCNAFKDVTRNKTREKIKLVDRTIIEEKSPGDNVTVFLPYPLPSPDRPKSKTVTYNGKKGATVDVAFDSTGVVKAIDADCPEINKIEQRNIELDHDIKSKEMEATANIELAKVIGNRLVIVGFFFSLAWVLRKFIK